MKPFNIILCLFFPCLAFILIGMFVPDSGVAMIMTGLASMVWAVLTSLAAGVWFLARFTVPVILPLVGGVTIFKIKRALSEKPSRGDTACGIAAGISLLLIALSLHILISVGLLLGCVAVLLATGVLRAKPASPDEIKSVIGMMCGGTGVMLFMVIFIGLLAGYDHSAEKMYLVGDSVEKIKEDDAVSAEKLNETSPRTENRLFLFHEAVNMTPFSTHDDVETLGTPNTNVRFTCSQGVMKNASSNNMSSFTAALARRVCLLRDLDTKGELSPSASLGNLYAPDWTPAQIAHQDGLMIDEIFAQDVSEEEKKQQLVVLAYAGDEVRVSYPEDPAVVRVVSSAVGTFSCRERELRTRPDDVSPVNKALMQRYCVVAANSPEGQAR